MNGFPPKATNGPQGGTEPPQTDPESVPALQSAKDVPGPSGSGTEPPKPEHAPTATEDHARALESRVAELEAELKGNRQELEEHRHANSLRALKERYPSVPGHVVDRLAETAPAEALETIIRATVEAVERSRVASGGGGGLGDSSQTKPGGFAGLFKSRDRAKQSRPFTI